jgi:hypothetical protein
MATGRRAGHHPLVSQILVRCRSRTELPVEEFRSWLERRPDAARPARLTVVRPDAPDGATWLVEVDVGDRPVQPLDRDVGELVTDLRLLGLDPAVFVPHG